MVVVDVVVVVIELRLAEYQSLRNNNSGALRKTGTNI